MVRFGQKLKDERLRRNLTLDEVAVATKIKRDFLAAIEREAYEELPSPAYAKGFVQNYADFLELPKAQSSALFKRDFDEKRALKVLPDGMTNQQDFPLKRRNIRKTLIACVASLFIFSFLLFQYRAAFFAPQLRIDSPVEGAIVTQDFEISGKAASSAVVTVNNNPVFVNSKGEFVKKLTLFSGNTNVVVKARNRFGRETIVKRNIIVK